MKKISLSILIVMVSLAGFAQILTSDPPFPTANDEITIYYNTTTGNAGIPSGTIPIFAHTGVVTQEDVDNCENNWQYVQGNWGTADPNVIMTPLGGNLHKIVITPSTYYGYPNGFDAARLMFVFRNNNGSAEGKNADGSDIYLDLYEPGFHAGIISPYQAIFFGNSGQNIPVNAATSEPATITISVNGEVVASGSGITSLNYTFNETTNGVYNIELSADNGVEEINQTKVISINPQPVTENPPAGNKDGITYLSPTSVRLQLYAPNKDFVYVLGDFNDWQFDNNYFMKRSVDGSTYWLEINNLTPGEIYRFQYSIDAEDLRVADIYSELILDPWNDQYISESTYPNMPQYPGCKTSQVVGVLQTAQPAFNWTDQSFVRPAKTKLVIYELLIRDFVENQNYQTLIDTLDYIENLGITAIQLMPINEFEGNNSWGYNPSFYFAPDKAYGTEEKLKEFVNECHNRGIAVILDIALNHSFGQSPMVRMYFNPDAGPYGQPTPENPWFNQTDKHPFGVGYDFNHEAPRVRQFTKRVLEYWMDEYHIDGYRFDLSKGFTQVNTLGNVAAWNQYDQSRINIWNDYYNHMQTVEPGSYVILEHLGNNDEETVLANAGMMLWGKMTTEYEQAAMGYSENSNLSWASHTTRGWNSPHLVSYAESHDEERVSYKTRNFGNSSGSYNITQANTAWDRQELAHAFLIPIPGPKMIWQFGELAYDFSINYCPSNGQISDQCRTDPKPIRWDYRDVSERYKIYKVVSALNNLKKNEALFSTTDFNIDLGGFGKRIHLNSNTLNCTVVGNFNVTPIDMIPGFQHTGTWYNYFTGEAINVTSTSASMNFQPGEYHLYFDQQMATPDTTVNVIEAMNLFGLDFMLYPNPASDVLNIGFTNEKSGQVTISVLDMTGHEVALIESRNMGQGKQSIQWPTSTLPIGAYIVRVQSAGSTTSRPLIISR